MASSWILLHSIPPSGKIFVLDDQTVWTEPLSEFGIPCKVLEPLHAEFTVWMEEGGVLVRGSVAGTVALPCDRCTEDAVVVVKQTVDTYEPFPAAGGDADDDTDADSEVVRYSPSGQGMEINLAALAWEEFSLALPMKPLCDTACRGLCPSCGANKNTGGCSCEQDTFDPRMAPLRGLKVGH